jgi:hypothetical protein
MYEALKPILGGLVPIMRPAVFIAGPVTYLLLTVAYQLIPGLYKMRLRNIAVCDKRDGTTLTIAKRDKGNLYGQTSYNRPG